VKLLERIPAVKLVKSDDVSRTRSPLMKLIRRDKFLLLLVLPCVLYFFIFSYIPMLWNIIAFKDYNIGLGILGSEWVGLEHFQRFFSSPNFTRVIKNTLAISFMELFIGFPVPIIFALLLNEVRHRTLKRFTQTVSYLPHFVSIVVVVGMMLIFLSPNDGLINTLIIRLGGESINFFGEASWFRWLYVSSNIWENFGWDSIIYFAAIAGINPDMYESAVIDGAGRWSKMWYVTLPTIAPTIIILLVLRIGWLLGVGFEKIILMYNPATYSTADVISTYVYRVGLLQAEYSYGTSIGLFNSVLSLILLLSANYLSRRITDTSLF